MGFNYQTTKELYRHGDLYAMLAALNKWVSGGFKDFSQHVDDLEDFAAIVNTYYPPVDTLGYRATKFSGDKLPHIISGEPFTIKATQPLRSWTSSKKVCLERFVAIHSNYKTVVNVILTERIPSSEIVLDLSDDRAYFAVTDIVEHLLEHSHFHDFDFEPHAYDWETGEEGPADPPDSEGDEQYKIAWGLYQSLQETIKEEKEIIRRAKTRDYAFCRGITDIIISAHPDNHSMENLQLVRDKLPSPYQEKFEKLINGNTDYYGDVNRAHIKCSGGKLSLL